MTDWLLGTFITFISFPFLFSTRYTTPRGKIVDFLLQEEKWEPVPKTQRICIEQLEVEYQNEHFFCRRPSISIRWLEEEQVRNFIVWENSKERERPGKMERMEEAEIHTLFSSITLVHCCGYKTFWPQHLKRVGENIKAADAAVVSIFGNKTTGIGQDLAIEIRQGKWRKNDRKGKYFLSFHTRLAREVISHTNIVFHLSQLDFLPNLTTQETPCSMENPCAFRDNQSGNLNPNVVAFLWIHDKWFQSNNCLKCWVL